MAQGVGCAAPILATVDDSADVSKLRSSEPPSPPAGRADLATVVFLVNVEAAPPLLNCWPAFPLLGSFDCARIGADGLTS